MSLKIKDESNRSTGNGPLAVIDGDIIARACASAADGRGYRIESEDLTFKYIKTAMNYCENYNIDKDLVQLSYRPDPESWATHSVDEMVFSILRELDTNNYVIYLSSGRNFRYDIYPEYKANRKNKNIRIPEHLKACKEHLKVKWDAIECTEVEADDAIAKKMYDEMNIEDTLVEKNMPISCSLDKDMDTFEGWHFNWNTNEKYYIDPIEAKRNFYKQMITGDTADNINGLSEKKPKKRTYKTEPIDKMTNSKDMEWYVYCGYVKKYGEESALKEMLLNGQVLCIYHKPIKEGLWEITI